MTSHASRLPTDWHRLVLDSVAEVVIVMDAAGALVWANRTAQVVLGYDPEAEVGRNVLDWIHAEDVEEAARLLTMSLQRGYSWPLDVRVRHADGTYLTMAVSDMDPIPEQPDQFVVSLRRVQAPRTAGGPAGDLSAPVVVLHHVSDAVVAVGAEGQVIFRNRAAIDLFRLGAARVMAPLPAGIVVTPLDPWHADTEVDPFVRVRAGEKVARYEARLTFPDGAERLAEITGEPLTDRAGRAAGGVVAFRDVTELRRQEADLRQLALRDALTGLANRTELMARLRGMLADCLLHGGQVAVMFVDLDRFKDINDSFDHLVGDEVLQTTARRLLECAGDKAVVARFGGEEFVVAAVLANAEADLLAQRIVERLREPMHTVAGALSTSCSVGLTAGSGAAEPEQLLREADSAVYSAKRLGGATSAWYDRTQRERSVHRLRATRRAQELVDTVRLTYRPVLDLASGAVLAVRAEVPEADRAVVSAQSALDRRVIAAFLTHIADVDLQLRQALGAGAPLVMAPLPVQALAQQALVGELEARLDDVDFPVHRRVIDVVTFDGPSLDAPLLAAYTERVGARFVLDDARVLLDTCIDGVELALWAVRAPRGLVRRLPSEDPSVTAAMRALADLAGAHGVPLAADRVDTAAQRAMALALGATVGWGDDLAPAQLLEDLLVDGV